MVLQLEFYLKKQPWISIPWATSPIHREEEKNPGVPYMFHVCECMRGIQLQVSFSETLDWSGSESNIKEAL